MSKERDALLLAGQMAISAERVLRCRAVDLTANLRELQTTLRNYDDFIMDWHTETQANATKE